jgi:hypothetical protein
VSYPNLKLAALMTLPWTCGIAAATYVAPYTPPPLWVVVCVGVCVAVTSSAGIVLTLASLGGDSAKPQPDLTAGANAHDALHPLESAPLPQRRPWALLSTRAILTVCLSATAAAGSTWIYADNATRVPVTRGEWIFVLAVVWIALFVAYMAVAVLLIVFSDASAEQRGGPEADAHRNL